MGFFKDRYSRPGPGIPKDAPKKKGLALFFEILVREAFELIKLNLLFLLFCVPVVTIPAAITAMSRVTGKMVRDENHYLWEDFWGTFKKEFVPATLGGWLLLIVIALSVVGILFYSGGVSVSGIFMLPLVVTVAVGLVTLMASFYFFPMLALVDLPLKQLLKNALLLSVVCPLPNLLAAVIFILSMYFMIGLLFFAVPIILFLACALLNFICTFAAYGGLCKFVIAEDPE